MPKYFGSVYKDYKNQYSIGNAIVVSLMGLISALSGGIVSDRLEKKKVYMGKAYVCIFAGVAGIPTIMGATLIQNNFWVSLVCLGLEYLMAECWVSPAITMVVNTISPENKGFAVSAYLFVATVCGTISTALLNQLQKQFDAADNPELYGYILCAFVIFSYGGSLPFFILAGRQYTKFMKEKDAQKE